MDGVVLGSEVVVSLGQSAFDSLVRIVNSAGAYLGMPNAVNDWRHCDDVN